MKKTNSSLWILGISISVTALLGYLVLASRAASRPVVINQTAVPPLPTLNDRKAALGADIYAQHCAQCHGTRLEGSPTWKEPLPDGSLPPPPHDDTGHTWHHPDGLLMDIISNGGDPALNSKMPPFKDKLRDEEMEAILEYIKSKWNREAREFQWWITSRPNLP